MENRDWRRVYGSIIIAVIFGCLGYFALNFMDCFSGGCAVTFISLFLVLSALGTAGFFLHRARITDGILSGKDLLAHWIYSDEESKKSAEQEYLSYREANKALFILVGGMFGIAIILMILFGGESGLFTAGVLFTVLVLIFIVSRAAPILERRRALDAPKDAYIAKNGIIYEGRVYPFHSFLMRQNHVGYREGKNRRPPVLVFSFFQLIGIIPRPFDVSVPVPAGQEMKAREILHLLGGTDISADGSDTQICQACGATIPEGMNSCEECGEDMALTTKGLPATCPGCGTQVSGSAKYCGNCGKSMK